MSNAPKDSNTYKHHLRFTKGPLKGKVYAIDGVRITLGRNPDTDIPIDDPALSRSHALLIRHGSGYTIKDNNSANGVFVNQSQVKQSRLRTGDQVQIGKTVFEYLLTDLSRSPSPQSTPGHSQSDIHQSASPGWLARLRAMFAQRATPYAEKTPANRRRVVLYSILLFAIGLALLQDKKDPTEQRQDPSKHAGQDRQPGTAGSIEEKIRDYKQKISVKLTQGEIAKKTDRMYAQALLAHDTGRYTDALHILDEILMLNPEFVQANIKRKQWRREREEIGEKLLARAIRNFENRYYEESMRYFKQVLLMIPEPDHSLHKQAKEGLRATRKKLPQ